VLFDLRTLFLPAFARLSYGRGEGVDTTLCHYHGRSESTREILVQVKKTTFLEILNHRLCSFYCTG
jgi:hypothetical protein